MADFYQAFGSIDQHRVWLLPYLPIHQAYQASGQTPLASWLNHFFHHAKITPTSHTGQALEFTDQSDLPHGVAYEKFIGDTAKIPTRDNLHDWFGACVWSVFPKTKSLLNAKHLAYLNDNHTTNGRNRVRDTITVFDENGAILVVADDKIGTEIGQALVDFDWQTCLVKHRQHWSDYQDDNGKKAKAFIFGHALLEQLITPYKSLCSHTVVLRVPPQFFMMDLMKQLAFVDEKLADYLQIFLDKTVTPRQLNPLPILGVPHFWQGQDTAFYADTQIFRTGRRQPKEQ